MNYIHSQTDSYTTFYIVTFRTVCSPKHSVSMRKFSELSLQILFKDMKPDMIDFI